MRKLFQRLGLGGLAAALCLGIVAAVSGQAAAQTKFPMVTFSFPSIANVTVDVILGKVHAMVTYTGSTLSVTTSSTSKRNVPSANPRVLSRGSTGS